MDESALAQIRELLRDSRFEEALARLEEECARDPQAWNVHYFTGFTYRAMGRLPEAIEACQRALALQPEEPHIHLNLGVCLQQSGAFPEAISSLEKAIELAPDLILAYNMLGLTLRMVGRGKDALQVYDRGLDALFSTIYMALENSPDNALTAPRHAAGQLWVEKALAAAMYYASEDGVERVAWPSGDQAELDEEMREHRGLYFVDSTDEEGALRFLLPNYFHTVREALKGSVDYAMFLSNIGEALASAGMTTEAEAHFTEAIDFVPEGMHYAAPHQGLEGLRAR